MPQRLLCRRAYRCLHSVRSKQTLSFSARRSFHGSAPLNVVKPYILADIGEGITECQIISWSVKPGDKVEQFDTICEVSSDKATVEITSRFDGTIKALHYEENDVAIVGKPLLDIDLVDDGSEADEPAEAPNAEPPQTKSTEAPEDLIKPDVQTALSNAGSSSGSGDSTFRATDRSQTSPPAFRKEVAFEATPAVRQLLKLHNISITNVEGTGKGGRVTKEDVERYLEKSRQTVASTTSSTPTTTVTSHATEEDRTVRLNSTENQMFKVMTRSLTIPHFLYTHSVDVTAFNELRSKIKSSKVLQTLIAPDSEAGTSVKLTLLPFLMKALSRVFSHFPKMNSHLDPTDPANPRLTLKAGHHFGMAIDTPQGLLVPVIKNVQDHSIVSLAAEIKRVGEIARAGRLKPEDFQGATFTVSNIGSVGAGCQAVSPVIVAPMVGILGMGRISDVPVFSKDDQGVETIVKEQQLMLSWSADHRIIDGATVAKAADMLTALLVHPDSLGLLLR